MHLNLRNTDDVSYIPIYRYENYIYLIRESMQQYELEGQISEYCTIYDAFLKYNIENHTIEYIKISKNIINYFFDKISKVLYYIALESPYKVNYVSFYRLDIKMSTYEKQFQIGFEDFIENNSLININETVKSQNIIYQIMPFVLSESYIGYQIDKINVFKGHYSHFHENNKFDLYLYDINESKRYPIVDKAFSNKGFQQIVSHDVHGNGYIILYSALYNEVDKYEYLYNCDIDASAVRGCVDGIYILPVNNFTSEVKCNLKNISYKIVQEIGKDGAIQLISVSDAKIYYKVSYFDKGYSELIMYDIVTYKYHKIKLSYLSNILWISSSGDAVYIYDTKLNSTIEFSGYEWEHRRTINVNGKIIGVYQSQYLITEDAKIDNDELIYYTNIYNLKALELINIIQGQPFLIQEDSLIII